MGNWIHKGLELLTYEVEQLRGWLEHIYRGETVEFEMISTEPNPGFYLVESKEHPVRLRRICPLLEAISLWAVRNLAGECEVWLEFPLS